MILSLTIIASVFSGAFGTVAAAFLFARRSQGGSDHDRKHSELLAAMESRNELEEENNRIMRGILRNTRDKKGGQA